MGATISAAVGLESALTTAIACADIIGDRDAVDRLQRFKADMLAGRDCREQAAEPGFASHPAVSAELMPPANPDHRDLVIEMFADDEQNLLALIASLEHDVTIYRVFVLAALTALHEQAVQCDRLHDQQRRLRDQYRALREQILKADAA